MRTHRRAATAVACSLLIALTGCSSSSKKAPSTSGSASGVQPIASADQLYVSVGDSYAAGYQPDSAHGGSTTTNGFAYQVVKDAKAKGYRYTLMNFACAGATTSSILHAPGCKQQLLGPGAPSYGTQTQTAAAAAYLRAHRGKVGLITVSVGGNDLTACADAASATQCVASALTKVAKNLATLLKTLHAAAGHTARIVGITYPDVFLGAALEKTASGRSLAKLSVLAFRTLINPQLKTAYEAVGGAFVDVTKATGAYLPLKKTTTLPPYGKIPVPVAKICKLTFYCQFHDIHPRTNGYALIARLIAGTLPKH